MRSKSSYLLIILLALFYLPSCIYAQEGKEKVLTRAEVIEKLSASDFIKKKIGTLLNWGIGYDITKINRTNLAPTIREMEIMPIKAPPDDRTIIYLKVSVDDPGGLSNIRGVRADLSSIGKLPNMILVDNGLWGDETPDDGVFTLQTSVSKDIEKGSKDIPVAVSNKKGWVAIGKTGVDVERDPVIAQTVASPQRTRADDQSKVKLSVKVENPGRAEDIKSVIVDLTAIGYGKNIEMHDEGKYGDEVAYDGVYTLETTVRSGTNSGEKRLKVEATNYMGGKGYGEIVLVVE